MVFIMNNHFGKLSKYSRVIKKQDMKLKVNVTMNILYGTSILANISFNLKMEVLSSSEIVVHSLHGIPPLKSVILTCATNLRKLRVLRWKQKRKTRSVGVYAAMVRSPDRSLRKLGPSELCSCRCKVKGLHDFLHAEAHQPCPVRKPWQTKA
jgi:hypothetical protein